MVVSSRKKKLEYYFLVLYIDGLEHRAVLGSEPSLIITVVKIV